MEEQAVNRSLLLKEKEESVITNRPETDSVVEVRGSDCSVGLECLLNVVRALGMGSCLSGDGTDANAPPYGAETASSDGARLRRRLMKSSSMELRLHGVPGRMFLNGSSEVASLFSKQGKKGINQDAMLVWENFCSKQDIIFCGVFDGHGPYGHRVAKRVRDSFPLKLSAQLEWHYKNENGVSDTGSPLGTYKFEEIGFKKIDRKTSAPDQVHNVFERTFKTLKESFLKAAKVMDKELKLHPDIDCFCSGTTAVTLIKHGQVIVIGNVGDSRAILGTRDHNGSLTAVQLTIDLKPNLPKEAERINLCKGRVFALQNEPDVARVWLPHANSPGLAMARAFGDFCLKDFGLISVPDISYHRITEKDEFIVLATDGIWDVLSNQEVVDIVAASPRSSAARTLVEVAVRTWRTKYPTAKVDDCAVVCLFLHSDSDKSAYSLAEESLQASVDKSNITTTEAAADSVVNCSRLARTAPESAPLLGEETVGV
ncbi:hypothetical protein L6164_012154 [Bauhinia variegata]|uniref:Uncharacterized protein n=1 Tax=Bauhinia variegata TaxID=167791 RepID=A0ACB9P844_BAUVA|nr:hypothetical protein L6164_012154 [Bauhinia variegata]